MDSPKHYHTDERCNTFPALDFKLHNPSTVSELITRVTLEVKNCVVNRRPALEYFLACKNNDLVLAVMNHGYGPALNFSATVDLGDFGQLGGISSPLTFAQDEIRDGAKTDEGYHRAWDFPLIRKQDIDTSRLSQLIDSKAQKSDSFKPLHTLFGEGPEENERSLVVGSFNAHFAYTDVDGHSHNEQCNVAHVKRGAYGSPYIYVTESGFEYARYRGNMYSLIFPTCTYHFLIDPDSDERVHHISTSHEMKPDEFERIWLVVGAKKSVTCQCEVSFVTNRRELRSPPITLEIWNPRNTLNNAGVHSHSTSTLTVHEQSSFRPYNVKDEMKTKYWDWGY